jgi:hypothetical protein
MKRSGIRGYQSHEIPHSALLHAGYNLVLAIHRDELLIDWELAQQRKPLNSIEPLE